MDVDTAFIVIHNLFHMKHFAKASQMLILIILQKKCGKSSIPQAAYLKHLPGKCTLSTSLYLCTHVDACMYVHAPLCAFAFRLPHNDRLTVGATAPPQAAEKLCIPLQRIRVQLSRFKHAAHSHYCFSKYFQS